jgi:ribonuclease P protein component
MLPSHLRLKRREDFEAARLRGRRFTRDPLLIVNCLPDGLAHNRFGFVVSRRIGKAAARNLLKRRLRAAVWALLPGIVSGFDIVIIARPAASGATYQELEETLRQLFGHAGLLKQQHL